MRSPPMNRSVFRYRPEGGVYLNLKGRPLAPLPEIDAEKIANLCRVVRGLLFAAVDGPSPATPADPPPKPKRSSRCLPAASRLRRVQPKQPGRDRMVWSAGHCSPLFTRCWRWCTRRCAAMGEASGGRRCTAVYPEELARFRKLGGPSGHVESHYALADTSTGSSGHGISAGLGFAALHRSCGLRDARLRDRGRRRDRRRA